MWGKYNRKLKQTSPIIILVSGSNFIFDPFGRERLSFSKAKSDHPIFFVKTSFRTSKLTFYNGANGASKIFFTDFLSIFIEISRFLIQILRILIQIPVFSNQISSLKIFGLPPCQDYRTSALKSKFSASSPSSFLVFSLKIEPYSQNLGKSAFLGIFDVQESPTNRSKHSKNASFCSYLKAKATV